MIGKDFDSALITVAFALGATRGWRHVSAAAASSAAGLELAEARGKFSHTGTILRRFGEMADAHALTGALTQGTPKDRLFDIVLRRFDFLQMHRPGVIALLRGLPMNPLLAAWLAEQDLRSMGWLLEGAGVPAHGLRGAVRKRGLLAVWAWGVRAWMQDESPDLTGTMAAVDVALARAEQIAARFSHAAPVPAPEPMPGEPDPELPLDLPETAG